MFCCRGNVYGILSIVLGCAVNFNEGTLESFNVYANAIKDQFNYTQKQVEFLSSMSVGLGLAFVPGLFYDRYGPMSTSFLGLTLTVASFVLVWSTAMRVEFYHDNFGFMAAYFFTCGFGYEFMNIASLTTALTNFDSKYSGKISGIQHTCFWVGTGVYSWIFYAFFAGNGHDTYLKHDNVTGLMLVFVVSVGLVDTACVFLLRRSGDYGGFKELVIDMECDKEDSLHELKHVRSSVTDSVTYNTIVDNRGLPKEIFPSTMESESRLYDDDNTLYSWLDQHDKQLSLKQLLLSVNYQLFVWMVALSSCVSMVYEFNITVLTRSLHYDYVNTRLTVIIPMIRAIMTILVGSVSDHFINRISRLTIFIIGLVVALVSQIFLLLFANNLCVLVISLTTISMSLSVWASIPPVIMREEFYTGQFGRNWGICSMLGQVLGLGSQVIFGVLYDSQITEPHVADCYGMHCVRGGIGLTIGLNSISLVLGVCLNTCD